MSDAADGSDVSRSGARAKTAAALVIGNELLSGKVIEANVVVLAQTLRELGVELRRVVVIGDDIDEIAKEVKHLAGTHDWLFTSGGVGPTHDDVTVAGVARAFAVDVVSDPSLVEMLRSAYGPRCTDGHLQMALVPKGATLESDADVRWPTIRMENTWLLPGVPEIFRMKLAVVAARIDRGRRFVSRAVYTKMDEGDLKALLDDVVLRFPEVAVGSYPKWKDPSYKTKITSDGREVDRIDAARDAFLALLPAGEPQRVE